MSRPRLYLLQSGTLVLERHLMDAGHGLGERFEIPVPFFLLVHPKGNVVLDGGNPAEVAVDPRGHWGKVADLFRPLMRAEDACLPQLERHGVDSASVRYVVHSHLHLDHTGALGRFPEAEHVVHRRELEYAYAPDWFARSSYCRGDLDRPGVRWLLLADGEEFDPYGDGVLKTIPTPGHSPGHLSVLVDLDRDGPMLLVVDAASTRLQWESRALPAFLVSAIDTVRSVERLHRIAARTGAAVVLGHDPDAWAELRHAPEHYE